MPKELRSRPFIARMADMPNRIPETKAAEFGRGLEWRVRDPPQGPACSQQPGRLPGRGPQVAGGRPILCPPTDFSFALFARLASRPCGAAFPSPGRSAAADAAGGSVGLRPPRAFANSESASGNALTLRETASFVGRRRLEHGRAALGSQASESPTLVACGNTVGASNWAIDKNRGRGFPGPVRAARRSTQHDRRQGLPPRTRTLPGFAPGRAAKRIPGSGQPDREAHGLSAYYLNPPHGDKAAPGLGRRPWTNPGSRPKFSSWTVDAALAGVGAIPVAFQPVPKWRRGDEYGSSGARHAPFAAAAANCRNILPANRSARPRTARSARRCSFFRLIRRVFLVLFFLQGPPPVSRENAPRMGEIASGRWGPAR